MGFNVGLGAAMARALGLQEFRLRVGLGSWEFMSWGQNVFELLRSKSGGSISGKI